MNRIRTSAACAALLAIGSMTAAHAQSGPSGLDRMFAKTISQANDAEVMGGRLALKKSSSQRVRRIAETLITQHGQAEVALQKTARVEHIPLPQGTDAAHRALYKKLKGLNGAAFDRVYIAANVKDHYAAIALFNKELANGNDSEIRSFATTYLPDIENHTKMITALASNYGIPVGGPRLAVKGGRSGHSTSAEMPISK